MGCECLSQIFTGGTFGGKHQDWIVQKLLQFGLNSVYRKVIRIGNEYIVEFFQHTCLKMTAKPGIGTVAYNQICLTLFQKLCTADGGTVCDFNADIRIGLMEFLQIINEKIPADRIAGSNTQLAFQQIVSGQERFPFVQKLESRFYMLEQKFSFRS